MELFYYRRLEVYQRAKEFANKIYDVTESFPAAETYALSNQLQRAAVSVISNIAEGFGRFSDNDRRHFLDMANGSLMEISAQLEIAELRHYIDAQCLEQLDNEIVIIVKQLAKLRSRFTQSASSSTHLTPNTQHPTPTTQNDI